MQLFNIKNTLNTLVAIVSSTSLMGQTPMPPVYDRFVETVIAKQMESESSSLIQNLKSYLTGSSSKYSWGINYSSANFQCTIIRPHDSNRSTASAEILRTFKRDWRGQEFYRTIKNETIYTQDGKVISSKCTEDYSPFPMYPENYRYECESSKNNSTTIKVSTGIRVEINQKMPPVDGVLGSRYSGVSTFELSIDADTKKVPANCLSSKEQEEWGNSPSYRKSQKIVLTSTAADPIILTKDFPINLSQEWVEGGVSVLFKFK